MGLLALGIQILRRSKAIILKGASKQLSTRPSCGYNFSEIKINWFERWHPLALKRGGSMTDNQRPMEIDQKIFFIRGHRVMLDSHLALLYGVETKALNRVVRRNIARFPDDFMFQVVETEEEFLRCQIGTSKGDSDADARGGTQILGLSLRPLENSCNHPTHLVGESVFKHVGIILLNPIYL